MKSRKLKLRGSPVYAQYIGLGALNVSLIVKFTGLQKGYVVAGSEYKKGYFSEAWHKYTDKNNWKILSDYKEIV